MSDRVDFTEWAEAWAALHREFAAVSKLKDGKARDQKVAKLEDRRDELLDEMRDLIESNVLGDFYAPDEIAPIFEQMFESVCVDVSISTKDDGTPTHAVIPFFIPVTLNGVDVEEHGAPYMTGLSEAVTARVSNRVGSHVICEIAPSLSGKRLLELPYGTLATQYCHVQDLIDGLEIPDEYVGVELDGHPLTFGFVTGFIGIPVEFADVPTFSPQALFHMVDMEVRPAVQSAIGEVAELGDFHTALTPAVLHLQRQMFTAQVSALVTVSRNHLKSAEAQVVAEIRVDSKLDGISVVLLDSVLGDDSRVQITYRFRKDLGSYGEKYQDVVAETMDTLHKCGFESVVTRFEKANISHLH